MGSSQHNRTGLLLVDCLTDPAFDGGEDVASWAERMAPKLVRFRGWARRRGMPVIYVNDHFGNWRADRKDLATWCGVPTSCGAAIARHLKPGKSDYFLIKPRHSAFFETSLGALLEDLKIKRLILAGIATNLCVLFTAHDAHMRGYGLTVLSDCCAAESDFDHDVALKQLQTFCGARVCLSTEFLA